MSGYYHIWLVVIHDKVIESRERLWGRDLASDLIRAMLSSQAYDVFITCQVT